MILKFIFSNEFKLPDNSLNRKSDDKKYINLQ